MIGAPPGLEPDPDALRLIAIADEIAKAIPQGEVAVAAAVARGDAAVRVASAEPRSGKSGIAWVAVRLAPASRVTVDAWARTESARAGQPLLPPRPQLMSPSNVPPSAWGDLPVYYDFAQPWGKVSCECAHGDSGRRIRSFIVKPALTPAAPGT